MGGDWNVLKYSLDRLGGCCISSDMRDFSKRINSNSILDLRPFFFFCCCGGVWSYNQEAPLVVRLNRLFYLRWLGCYLSSCLSDCFSEGGLWSLPYPSWVLEWEVESCPFRFEIIWLQEEVSCLWLIKWWHKIGCLDGQVSSSQWSLNYWKLKLRNESANTMVASDMWKHQSGTMFKNLTEKRSQHLYVPRTGTVDKVSRNSCRIRLGRKNITKKKKKD